MNRTQAQICDVIAVAMEEAARAGFKDPTALAMMIVSKIEDAGFVVADLGDLHPTRSDAAYLPPRTKEEFDWALAHVYALGKMAAIGAFNSRCILLTREIESWVQSEAATMPDQLKENKPNLGAEYLLGKLVSIQAFNERLGSMARDIDRWIESDAAAMPDNIGEALGLLKKGFREGFTARDQAFADLQAENDRLKKAAQFPCDCGKHGGSTSYENIKLIREAAARQGVDIS